MNQKKLGRLIILAAAIATVAHFGKADGKFFFSDRNESEFVRVKSSRSSNRFVFSRCRFEGGCSVIGRQDGYTAEDIRIPLFKLTAKRERGKLSSSESRDFETLQEMINGIERPKLLYSERGYSHSFKTPIAHFAKVIETRLPAK